VENPAKACAILIQELKWVHADGGKVPRREYYTHKDGLPYSYGKGEYARTYESQPTNFVIEMIRCKLWNYFKFKDDEDLDVVFLNLYMDQHDHLGWHADNSPEMSDDYPIVTVSLGARREIWFRENGSNEVEKLMLDSGSAAIMLPGMQDTHQHRIPKSDRACGPRISLTFRKFVHV
jgi:alkylated DNA repair dioxygenase AlkB